MTICTAWHLQINLYLIMCIHQIFICVHPTNSYVQLYLSPMQIEDGSVSFPIHYYFRTVMFQFTHTTTALEGFSMNNIITTSRVFMENIQDIIAKYCLFKWQSKKNTMSSLFKTQRTFLPNAIPCLVYMREKRLILL